MTDNGGERSCDVLEKRSSEDSCERISADDDGGIAGDTLGPLGRSVTERAGSFFDDDDDAGSGCACLIGCNRAQKGSFDRAWMICTYQRGWDTIRDYRIGRSRTPILFRWAVERRFSDHRIGHSDQVFIGYGCVGHRYMFDPSRSSVTPFDQQTRDAGVPLTPVERHERAPTRCSSVASILSIVCIVSY